MSKKELTHKEMSARGGTTTFKKYGKEKYIEWGRKGGERTRELRKQNAKSL